MTVYLLQHLLEAQADQRPEHVAVVCTGRSLTYGELETESNRLARLLLECGVVRGQRIGILLPKSVETVISIYAILKTGGIYVPLDVRSPPQRLAFILRDCDIATAIAERSTLEAILQTRGANSSLRSVVLREGKVSDSATSLSPSVHWLSWEHVRAADSSRIASGAVGDDPAYIMYTSGSTGSPKGVVVSHRSVLAWVGWGANIAAITSKDRIGNQVPFHFDLSVFDTFVAAQGGASLILVPEEVSMLPIELSRFLEEQSLSVIYWVPSTLVRILLQGNLEQRNLERLRVVFFAGEVFPTKHLRKWMELAPNARFYNLYGSTEACACTYCFVHSPPADDKPVPIGRACDDVEVFAVDEEGELVVPGEVGELLVRGATLMKGYWNEPERTAAVLQQNPLNSQFMDLVYRTGDLVIVDEDGHFHFVGRKDTLVKCRGYRVELAEVEAVLLQNPQVTEVAVVALPDENFTNRLKAFVVARSEHLSENEVLQHCSSCLPSYAVPSIELIAELPKTPSGKIDRHRLAEMERICSSNER